MTIVYEDPWVKVIVPIKAMVAGQLDVVMKSPVTCLDQLSDEEFEHVNFVASYASTALFELLGAQGTNVLCNEDDGPLTFHILARREGDNLGILWSPTKGEQLDETAQAIKDSIDIAQWQKEQDTKEVEVVEEPSEVKSTVSKENYLLRHFRRRP